MSIQYYAHLVGLWLILAYDSPHTHAALKELHLLYYYPASARITKLMKIFAPNMAKKQFSPLHSYVLSNVYQNFDLPLKFYIQFLYIIIIDMMIQLANIIGGYIYLL